jgi:hypothetical protein
MASPWSPPRSNLRGSVPSKGGMARRTVLLLCVLVLTGCGGKEGTRERTAAPPRTVPAEFLDLYEYDSSAPVDVQEEKSEEKDGATVHTISYAGPTDRITAFLVAPEGDGPFPAVLFMPGAPGAR